MKLTDIVCKTSKPSDKVQKLSDGGGLYLEIKPSGPKYWKQKYRYAGKEKKLSHGVYPEVSLKEAREKRDKARKLLMDGIDPQEAKKEVKRDILIKSANSFEAVAREWHEVHSHKVSEKYAQTIMLRMESDIFPEIGARPISDLRPPEIYAVLKKIEKRGAHELAHRAKQYIGQVMRYAIATSRAERDYTADLKDALPHKKVEHYAALEPRELPEFLKVLERNDARLYPQTRIAVQFLMLTFVRTGEMIQAKWEEFDLKDRMWTIPAERMKMRSPHLVPLSHQVMALLDELKNLSIANSEWVFPSQIRPRNHMSNNTVLEALRRMGYRGKMTGHGFRALAMTTIKERLNYRHEVIDRQLAHSHRNSVTAAYDRAKFLTERIQMMQEWADYIDDISRSDKVINVSFGEKS